MTFSSYLPNSCFAVYIVGFYMHFKDRKFSISDINHYNMMVNIGAKKNATNSSEKANKKLSKTFFSLKGS